MHEAPHDYLRHTRYSLEWHARTAGLEVVELSTIGGLIDVVTDTVAKGLAVIPVVGGHLARLVQGVALIVGRTGLGSRVRAATANIFPLCHLLVARKPPLPS